MKDPWRCPCLNQLPFPTLKNVFATAKGSQAFISTLSHLKVQNLTECLDFDDVNNLFLRDIKNSEYNTPLMQVIFITEPPKFYLVLFL